MTAPANYWEAGLSYRQEWMGFAGAPRTGALYAQYPFEKQNASIGGFFLFDEVKPVRSNIFALSYAYKIGPRVRGRRQSRAGQLSLGLMAVANHVLVDALELVANDPDDPLQPTGERSKLAPNVGAGLYYRSGLKGKGPGGSYFFAGMAANQLLPSDLVFRAGAPVPNFKRAFHGNATLGYRAAGQKLVFTPSLWLNFAGANISDSQFNLIVEQPEAFWAGLSYAFSQTLAIQMGYSIPAAGPVGSRLRIGVLGTLNTGSFGDARGLGFEFMAAYRVGEADGRK